MKIFVMDKYRFLFILSAFALSLSILFSYLVPNAKEEKLLPIYSVETNEKKVAITFDSAWSAEDIESISQTLQAEGCDATFFVVGSWAEKYPESVKLLYETGNEIAGHSYNHAHYASMDKDALIADMTKCDTVIKDIIGVNVPLFRSPYGEYNNTVVMAANDTYRYLIQWDIDSLDWKNLTEEEMKERILPKLKNGSIILFHNGTKNTASALPGILKAIKEKGYTFSKVSDLIYKENYEIAHDGTQKKRP